MGLISRFGNFLDYYFAEKALKSEMLDYMNSLEQRVQKFNADLVDLSHRILDSTEPIDKLKEDNLKLRDELNAIKALYKIGGTKSPQNPLRQKFDGSEAWKR